MLQRWWILTGVACGTFMAILDASIINIAIQTLMDEFHESLILVKWVVIAYFLALTALLLPFGRISDSYGRKKIFSSGFIIFILGSALCGFADGLISLIFFRVIQAIGAAMLMANGPAIITASFPVKERGRALGVLAMVVSLGLISGPVLGGLIISGFGWRYIFLLNIPIGLIGFFLVYRFVERDSKVNRDLPFDWLGSILQLFAMICFTIVFDYGKVFGGREIYTPYFRASLGAITAILYSLFIWVELRAVAPIFDLRLLKNRVFLFSNLAALLVFIGYSGIGFMMPFYLQHAFKLEPQQTGILMSAIPIVTLFVSPISGRLSDYFGSRELCILGTSIMTFTHFFLAFYFGTLSQDAVPGTELLANATHFKFFIILGLGLFGLGLGLFQTPNNNAVMSAVPLHKLSLASALISTIRNMGIVMGSGLATAVFLWRLEFSPNSLLSFKWMLMFLGVISAGAMIASMANKKGPFEI